MDSQILVAILAGLSAILVALLTQAYNRNISLRSELGSKKQHLYSKYVVFIHDFYSLTKSEEDLTAAKVDELADTLKSFYPKLLTFASNDVVRSAGDFLQHLYKYDQKAIDNGDRSWHIVGMEYFGDLIISIRRDLGHRRWLSNMRWYDVMRLSIFDINKFVPAKHAHDRSKHRGPRPIILNEDVTKRP